MLWWCWRLALTLLRVGHGLIQSSTSAHFPNFVRVFGGKAFAHESAYCVDGYAGAALWLPPEVHPDEDALISLLQSTGSAQFQKDGGAVFEQMGRYHPREPHWYLPFIGVEPFHQGKGYGAALMQHALDPVRSRPDAGLSRIHQSEEYPAL